MRTLIASIEGEYRRYQTLGEGAMAQVADDAGLTHAAGSDNSSATSVWPISGNLKSRFTDFLPSDGEKPGRDRDSEFLARDVTRAGLQTRWEEGWRVLFASLADLTDADLERTVTIRAQPLTVAEALHRSLAHTSYHVGQIVYLAKALCGTGWRSVGLSPPP